MGPDILAALTHFPKLWYADIPAWWWRFLKRLLIYLDNQLAVQLMTRLWLVPVWQDTTLIGRGLSLSFRTTRIVIGVCIITAATLATFFWIIIWLLLPLLLIIAQPVAVTLLILLWVIDAAAELTARLRDPARLVLQSAKGDASALREILLRLPDVAKLLTHIEKEEVPQPPPTLEVERLKAAAEKRRTGIGDDKLRVEHLFLALLDELRFHAKDANLAYLWERKKRLWGRHPWIWEDDYPIRPIGGVNRGWTGIVTHELDRVSIDLTQLAARGKIPELTGRQQELAEMVRILGREGRENVLLIGEPGVGKTTLVEALANEIIRGTEYHSLQFKRVIALDIAAATAGSVGTVKERMVRVIEEIKAAGNIILVIDQIENLVSAEEGQTTSAVFAALEPHLDAGEFQFIATTTPGGFKRTIEPSEAFSRTFRVITLSESSVEESLAVLERKAFELERDHGVVITHLALRNAVELARRYIHDRFLPDSANDLLEETVTKIAQTKKIVTTRDLEDVVTERTHIPVRAAETEKEKTILLNLEKALHKRVVGQDEAIESLADALRRARTGFAEEGRLLASFLFAGATGVGKTETAKALAQVYFGSEEAMVRLDMSEFQTDDSINRLIGPPPGKPGHELGGQLTEAVRRRPFTVILLDEIEKANPRIMDVFLQLLDDARLTDGSGRTVDFSNAIVIATSNVGTKALIDATQQGKPAEEQKRLVLTALKESFRPEFLNRFSGMIVYKPLKQEEILAIARLHLADLRRRMKKKEILLRFSNSLVTMLAEKGYDPQWGARELRRIIRDVVEERIARKILEGKIKPGEKYTISPEFLAADS